MPNTYTTSQWVPYPLQAVFNLFSDPRNLPPLMPAWQQARLTRAHIVPPPPPAGRAITGSEAGAGSEMRILFRPFPHAPFRIAWDARIVAFAWDDHFCDVQLDGPLGSWRHCHRLTAANREGQPGTTVTDEVTLAFPFGVAGELAWQLGGRRQIASIFRFRQRTLLQLLRRAADRA